MARNVTKIYKPAIRSFMRMHYTDARLAELLAHAQDGKLSYNSCCCFVAIPTASHALRERWDRGFATRPGTEPHYREAKQLTGAEEAEEAFLFLGHDLDEARRRILIPMIRAEMRRRERLAASAPTVAEHLQAVQV